MEKRFTSAQTRSATKQSPVRYPGKRPPHKRQSGSSSLRFPVRTKDDITTFFHLFRTRVRLLERNYYNHFFDPETSPETLDWSAELAETLRYPKFTIGRRQAMARRLSRNYGWIFLILLAVWLLKITTAVLQPRTGEAEFIRSLDEFLHNTAIGYIPGGVVLAGVLILYLWLFYVMIRHRTNEGELTFGEVHV